MMDKQPTPAPQALIPGVYAFFYNKRLSESEQDDYDQREEQAAELDDDGDDNEDGEFADPYEDDYLYKDAVLVGPIELRPERNHVRIIDTTRPLSAAYRFNDDDDDNEQEDDGPYPVDARLYFYEDGIALGKFIYNTVATCYLSGREAIAEKIGNRPVSLPSFREFLELAAQGNDTVLKDLSDHWQPNIIISLLKGMSVELYVDTELVTEEQYKPDQAIADAISMHLAGPIQDGATCGRILLEDEDLIIRAWWQLKKKEL